MTWSSKSKARHPISPSIQIVPCPKLAPVLLYFWWDFRPFENPASLHLLGSCLFWILWLYILWKPMFGNYLLGKCLPPRLDLLAGWGLYREGESYKQANAPTYCFQKNFCEGPYEVQKTSKIATQGRPNVLCLGTLAFQLTTARTRKNKVALTACGLGQEGSTYGCVQETNIPQTCQNMNGCIQETNICNITFWEKQLEHFLQPRAEIEHVLRKYLVT